MTRPKRKTEGDGKDDVVFARMHNPENLRFIYGIMADTRQPMREVVERMVEFCRVAKSFKVPVRETTAEKLAVAQKEREERLRSKAAGGE